MKKELSFKVTREEHELIGKIVDRAAESLNFPRLETMMDLTACHANGNPLDLAGLVEASALDFAHDLGGIARHINRQTGELGDCFSPRYAKRGPLTNRPATS